MITARARERKRRKKAERKRRKKAERKQADDPKAQQSWLDEIFTSYNSGKGDLLHKCTMIQCTGIDWYLSCFSKVKRT